MREILEMSLEKVKNLKKEEVKKEVKKFALASFVLIAGLLMFSVTAQAVAVDFTHRPEDSGMPWLTIYPDYQRNIYWDFDNPNDIYEAEYGGVDDLNLYGSDLITVTGDVQYHSSVSLDGYTGTGLIGIVNPAGSGVRMTGEVTFHIDNWDREYPYVKHIWKELVFAEAADGTSSDVLEYLYPPEGEYSINGPALAYQDPLNGLFRRNSYWYSIEPNPSFEEIVIRFEVNPGYYALVDSLHIATECVPEPGTMILLGSLATGLFGMAGLKRRFGRS